MGEMVHDVVDMSIRALLNPALTASWEKGLMYVAEGNVSTEEYMEKLESFVTRHIENVKRQGNVTALRRRFDSISVCYKKGTKKNAAHNNK